jgi:hypothetical protein
MNLQEIFYVLPISHLKIISVNIQLISIIKIKDKLSKARDTRFVSKYFENNNVVVMYDV